MADQGRKLTEVKDSSLFAAVGYDAAAHELSVQFKSGSIYVYQDFTPNDWKDLCAAESKGSHFSKHIRNSFRCQKLDDQGAPVAESDASTTKAEP